MMELSCPLNGQITTDTAEFFRIFFKDSGGLGWDDHSKIKAIRLDRVVDSLYVVIMISIPE
jgi:hypothetical protein